MTQLILSGRTLKKWSRGRDLNPRPADYEMDILTLFPLLSAFLVLPESPSFAPFR